MKLNTLILSGTMVLFLIAAVSVFAHGPGMGRGYGHMMDDDAGPGWHHRGTYAADLSSEEIAELDQLRADFFKATDDIRQKLKEKNNDLRIELSKDDPDKTKASALQSEISRLRAELDQERLDFELEAGKTIPDYRRGHRGQGPMMRYGSYGAGNCMWQ